MYLSDEELKNFLTSKEYNIIMLYLSERLESIRDALEGGSDVLDDAKSKGRAAELRILRDNMSQILTEGVEEHEVR